MLQDEKYMSRCLQLASIGAGHVSPNPMVGAVVVHNGIIIGEGYHQKYAMPHAEPNAIASVLDDELLKESTLYVNLEPCSHYGKTPPCAELIIKKGIKRVVIGMLDPHPLVLGRGVKQLQEAGVEVVVGVLEDQCRELNKFFLKGVDFHRPYVILKWAETVDGYIDGNRDASEKASWLTGTLAKSYVHKLRSEIDAIMVGTSTVVNDNPSLTVRNWVGRSPIRVTIDRTGRIPEQSHIKNSTQKSLIFTQSDNRKEGLTEYIEIDFSKDIIPIILETLYKQGIRSLLVEGGTMLLQSFIDTGSYDEVLQFISPLELKDINGAKNGGIKAPIINIEKSSTNYFGKVALNRLKSNS